MGNNNTEKIIEAIQTHHQMLIDFEQNWIDTIISIADLITKAINQGGCLYICGNGGSAADAQHIAGELIGRFRKERQALPAVALSTDTSVITSIANDYSYDKVFERQVEALVTDKDVLLAISTSGGSGNIVAAAILAQKKGAKVIAFTGKSSSKLEKNADICFCAKSEMTARTQEIHQLAYHIICELVENNFCEG